LNEDDYRTRALLQFAGEEAKHIHLFKKFAEEFNQGFVTYCETIGPAEEIGRAVLSHSPLGVTLVILGIEWATQKHYLESIRDDNQLDSQFKSLLRHHWIEEAQHTKVDTLMLQALTDHLTPAQIEKGVSDYASIGGLFDGGLKQQVDFDLLALQRAAGRTLNEAEQERFRSVQLQALRWTYLGSAMTHPNFLATVGEFSPGARNKLKRWRRRSVENSVRRTHSLRISAYLCVSAVDRSFNRRGAEERRDTQRRCRGCSPHISMFAAKSIDIKSKLY
jgi:hypothetical protein